MIKRIKNPWVRRPLIVVLIIPVCVLAFIYSVAGHALGQIMEIILETPGIVSGAWRGRS